MTNRNRYFYEVLIFFIVFMFNSVGLGAQGTSVTNSVLASGNWYKIQIPTTGIYKLTYSDLKKIGLSDPKNVHVYGYGGAILDEDFSKPYINDLPEVAILMSSSPENFGENDYILFYGQGNIKWSFDNSLGEFVQVQNPYSFNSYYFITESVDSPKLMDNQTNLDSYTHSTSTFNDYFLHQEQLVNVGRSGRDFYGEDFTVQKNRNFNIDLQGVIEKSAILRFDFISKAPISSGTLEISLNNKLLGTYYTAVTTDYYVAATSLNDTMLVNFKEKNVLNFNYTRGSSSDYNVRLGYIRVNYERDLKSYGAVTLFRNTKKSNSLQYVVNNVSKESLVFNVTENYNSKIVNSSLSGTTIKFNADNSNIQEYALVDLSKDIPKPTFVGKVENQNLQATKSAKMVIIVQPELQKYAEELAALHKADSDIESLIINPEKIYNEFSSGNPDVTAYRRFLKMLYDKAPVEEERPQYLLLYGGGTYDNRFIQKSWTDKEKSTMLLTYQSKYSLVETASYVTDDYMGFMMNDGADPASSELNLSVGRLPVRSQEEAATVLNKIKDYMNGKNVGIWQNNVTFVADDAVAMSNPVQQEKTHMSKSESLANYVSENYPDFIINKIYEDAYTRVPNANTSGATYPEATKALISNIENGTLVLNYIGHGSTKSWTHEDLLTTENIKALTNKNKLPLWVTATCDFSRFDGDDESGGEMALFNKNGGAIALFSTVRVVYMSNNKIMNENIIKHIFEKDSEGKSARLGDILRYAKTERNLSGDLNKLKFLLLGDPALRLYCPSETYKVEVAEVNGFPADGQSINIEGLSNVVIKGQIVDKFGEIVTSFDGSLESVVFDVEQTLTTKGNTASGTNENVAQDYSAYTKKLYTGTSKIENGSFEISFIAPKDILNLNGNGKMSFLAYDNNKTKEAQGVFTNYTVKGQNPNIVPEDNPPVISKLYLDKESFKSGDILSNSSPLLVAHVSDDSGINLSNNGEHNISILIDGKDEYNATDFFESTDGTNKVGIVKYQLPILTKGKHTLKFTVWDIWNNAATEMIDFTISSGDIQTFETFEIWGNPARDYTLFVFNADNPTDKLNLKMQVYSLSGQMVWAYEEKVAANGLKQYVYKWNLTGNDGGRLNPGIYICNVYITVDGKSTLRKAKKIIISNY